MAITVQTTEGTITIADNSTDETTSLTLPGRKFNGYGTVINQNLIDLLQNFAGPTEPNNPVEGQLWFDTGAAKELKVFDGSNFIDAGKIKSGATQPTAQQSTAGDLWSDTTTQQLYLWNGTAWVLIGPEYSEGLTTGAKSETVFDVSNNEKTVIKMYAQGVVVAVVSNESFTPKVNIPGLTTIKKGINLASTSLNPGILNGTASAAQSLLVNDREVLGSNFLRGDIASTSNAALSIKSNQGVTIGLDSSLKIETNGNTANVRQTAQNGNIDFNLVNDLGLSRAVLRLNGSTERVGINRNPDEALHIGGNLQISATTEAGENGDIIVDGSASIAGTLNVTGNTTLSTANITTTNATTINAQTILPSSATASIGAITNRVNNVYVENLDATTFTVGQINGNATSANKWASPISVQTGNDSDITFAPATFDGTANLVLSGDVNSNFVINKDAVDTASVDDQYLIQRGGDLFKLSFRTILDVLPAIPVGTIVPFGGKRNVPDGWHLCDGTEYRRSDYLKLFNVIDFDYKDATEVKPGFFAVPDLRGRMPLGFDTMGGTAANRTTDATATDIGLSNDTRTSERTINQSNLPEHRHTFDSYTAGTNNTQNSFYAVTTNEVNSQAEGVKTGIINLAEDANSDVATLDRTGFIFRNDVNEATNEPINIMPPYQTVSYIIYHGEIN
jgi:microcystin-dependent protein